MKVYQVCRREYWEELDEEYNLREYHIDYIEKNFLLKEKALFLKSELQNTYNFKCVLAEHCYNCPIHKMTLRKMHFLKNTTAVNKHCEEKFSIIPEIEYVNGHAICKSVRKLPDTTEYYIKEIDVEE